MKTTLIIPEFRTDEFPKQETNFYKSLEILSVKVNNKLDEFRKVDLEELSKQDLRIARATLNKLYKFINDARIRMKKDWDFQLNSYTEKFGNMLTAIDMVKQSYQESFDARETAEMHYKKKQLKEIFDNLNPFGEMLSFEDIQDKKWFRKSCEIETVTKEMQHIITEIWEALLQIDQTDFSDEQKIYCKVKLFEKLDLEDALEDAREFGRKLTILNNLR